MEISASQSLYRVKSIQEIQKIKKEHQNQKEISGDSVEISPAARLAYKIHSSSKSSAEKSREIKKLFHSEIELTRKKINLGIRKMMLLGLF
jgi:hypothetical protein